MPREVEITIEHENIKMSIAETSEERLLYSQANSVFEGKCEIKASGACIQKKKRQFLCINFGNITVVRGLTLRLVWCNSQIIL